MTKAKAMLKTNGYTLVDYTEKIKTFQDVMLIHNKVNTMKNDKYVYDKLVIIIDLEIVCKKLKGFKEYIATQRSNNCAMEVMHTKNNTYFDKTTPLTEVSWMDFLNSEDTQTCEICCETIDKKKMMPCHTCNYKCCRSCFMKRVKMTIDKKGNADVRCFGCRKDLLIITSVEKIPK